jgi:hypothetical protein
MRIARVVAASIASALLSGCLVSSEPLLDSRTARSTPVAAGAYQLCSREGEGKADDCAPVAVTIEKGKLTVIMSADGDRIEARFARAGKGYVGQLVSADDEDAHYYYGAKSGGAFSMTMIWCKHAPEALKASLAASGALVLESDGEVCRATSREAVTELAKAYARGEATDEGAQIRFVPVKRS